jgi:hypothetical protein
LTEFDIGIPQPAFNLGSLLPSSKPRANISRVEDITIPDPFLSSYSQTTASQANSKVAADVTADMLDIDGGDIDFDFGRNDMQIEADGDISMQLGRDAQEARQFEGPEMTFDTLDKSQLEKQTPMKDDPLAFGDAPLDFGFDMDGDFNLGGFAPAAESFGNSHEPNLSFGGEGLFLEKSFNENEVKGSPMVGMLL